MKGRYPIHLGNFPAGRCAEHRKRPAGRDFRENPYMAKIYPTEKSREALEVFQIYQGEGEYFDLGQLPPYRQSFSFGGVTAQETGYHIVPEKCIGCQGCRSVCPAGCISNTIPPALMLATASTAVIVSASVRSKPWSGLANERGD